MHNAAEQLLNLYESRAIDRRRFLEGLGIAAAAAAIPASASAAPTGLLHVTGVNHFEIKSVDFRKTRDFYQQLFGLEAETRADRAVVAMPGGAYLSIGAVRPEQASKLIDHFCFGVTEFADPRTVPGKIRDEKTPTPIVQKLQAAGYTVVPALSGSWAQPYVVDPDGRRVQLSDPKGMP